MLSTVQSLSNRLLHRWVPKWHNAFCDQEHGGFYERLGDKFKPLDMPYKRLVTQARQLSIYSHASLQSKSKDYREDLKQRFDFFVEKLHHKNGGWYFSVTPEGNPYDETHDLYGHAFVIFTLSLYYKASNDTIAKELALSTLNFIKSHFNQELGYAEALDKKLKPLQRIRRQNPHMHLFEACLFAYETFKEDAYLGVADEIYDLFCNKFLNTDTQTLTEFFDDDLTPHPYEGHIVEPGHQFEWVWLLQKYAFIEHKSLPDIREQKNHLLSWSNKYGWDKDFGGIFDAVDTTGKITKDSKRIWPFTEALKANTMMLDIKQDKAFIKSRTKQMIQVFKDKYIQERGFWTESLNRDLTPATDYMPGTTPYHIYFGIMETKKYLEGRGCSKSILAFPQQLSYTARRKLSSAVQFVKSKLNQG